MNKRLVLKFYALIIVLLGSQAAIAQPDAVAEWNQEAAALTVLPASALSPVEQTRVMAIVQLSMHDAANGMTRRFKTYIPAEDAPAGGSPVAAVIAAANQSLRTFFPGSADSLDAKFLASLAAQGLTADDPGVEYGRNAASQLMFLRSTDGAAGAQFPYDAPGAGLPGIFTHASPALLPGWGVVEPFVLKSGSQFRPEAPPALDSEQYARDYNEIKEIGSVGSVTRTALQTQIATFWLASPVAIWSQPLRDLVANGDFDLSERTRIFALVYLGGADSAISCWDAKYAYNYWRPQPAIRRGKEDGNEATDQDATWTPLFATPRHPEYPSGHSTVSTGMASIMAEFFGDKTEIPIWSTITGITREWGSFSEGIDEVIDARIYSGIHFRTADEVGSRQGGQVGQFVYRHALKPCRGQQCR